MGKKKGGKKGGRRGSGSGERQSGEQEVVRSLSFKTY